MLSKLSICTSCTKKNVCKYYEYASKNTFITMNIEECEEHHLSIGAISPEKRSADTNHFEPYRHKNPSYPDLNHVTSVSNAFTLLKATPVKEMPNGTCSICGKETIVENCSDCGEPVCSTCGYTTIDVDKGKPIITCDKCFGSHEESSKEETIDWDIKNFSSSDEVEKEETKDAKSRDKKTRNKRSGNDTKK